MDTSVSSRPSGMQRATRLPSALAGLLPRTAPVGLERLVRSLDGDDTGTLADVVRNNATQRAARTGQPRPVAHARRARTLVRPRLNVSPDQERSRRNLRSLGGFLGAGRGSFPSAQRRVPSIG